MGPEEEHFRANFPVPLLRNIAPTRTAKKLKL